MSVHPFPRIVVVGVSAGGPAALRVVLGALPSDFPAPVFVVMHLPIQADDLVPQNLRSLVALPVLAAADRRPIKKGRIYIAPPDYHLTLEGTVMRVERGPRENRARPAIDPLFRSAARAFGPRVVGMLLTGKLDDGVAGLNAVKTHGGHTIVQDPAEAVAPDMIRAALRNVEVDEILPLARIAPRLAELVAHPVRSVRPRKRETGMPPRGIAAMEAELGAPIPCVCPECHGPLWMKETGSTVEFRCHVGHAYSPEALLIDQDIDLEKALWSAIRMFDEQAALLQRIGKRDVTPPLVGKWEKRARQNEKNADALRRLLQLRRPV